MVSYLSILLRILHQVRCILGENHCLKEEKEEEKTELRVRRTANRFSGKLFDEGNKHKQIFSWFNLTSKKQSKHFRKARLGHKLLTTYTRTLTMKFKQEHTFEQRKAESERVRGKYPDRIPGLFLFCFVKSYYLVLLKNLTVICEKIDKSKIEVCIDDLTTICPFFYFLLLGHRQEEVFGSFRSYLWSVCLCDSQTAQTASRESDLLVRR